MESAAHPTEDEVGRHRWIGAPPNRWALAYLLLLGTVGMEITGVQPVLLGAVVGEGRLSMPGLGWATTAEFMALALAIGLAGSFLKPRRLKLVAALASLIAVIANLLSFREAGTALILNRAVAGFAEGIMVWIPSCMIARSATPAFWAGVFLAMQCSAQLLFASILPATLMARFGANGGFGVLAVLSGLALLAAPLTPSMFEDLPGHGAAARFSMPDRRGVAALLSVFLVAAFAIGFFSYLPALASEIHLPETTLGYAVSTALGLSIVGAAAASAAAHRLGHYPALVICSIAYVVLLVIMGLKLGAGGFIVACGLYGFFQVFFMPFQLPLVIEADPSRRSAVILPSVQLFGASAGPFFCSLFVTEGHAARALLVSGSCLAVSFTLATSLHFARGRSAGRIETSGAQAKLHAPSEIA